jgi:hypothetical protein
LVGIGVVASGVMHSLCVDAGEYLPVGSDQLIGLFLFALFCAVVAVVLALSGALEDIDG